MRDYRLIAAFVALGILSISWVWVFYNIWRYKGIILIEPSTTILAWELGTAVTLTAFCLFAICILLWRRNHGPAKGN